MMIWCGANDILLTLVRESLTEVQIEVPASTIRENLTNSPTVKRKWL